ncbi:MAG: Fic family protein [Anaerovoracaceae bacterium]
MIREIRKKLVVLSNRSPFPPAVKEYINHLEGLDWVYMNLRLDGSPLSPDEVEKIMGGEPVMSGRIMDHVFIERLDGLRNELYDLSQRGLDVNAEIVRLIAARAGAAYNEFRKTTPQLVEYGYTPVLPSEIPSAMGDYLSFAAHTSEFENPFEKAAELHNRFIAIYPFKEGNQVTARALMEYYLMHSGFPMAYLDISESEYNGMFAEFCKTKNSKPLAELLTKSVLDRLELMIQLTGY